MFNSPNTSWFLKIALAVVLALAGVFILAYLYTQNMSIAEMPTTGTLMISTSNSDPSKIPIIAYRYSFADSSLDFLPVDLEAYPGQELTFYVDQSPNGAWATFAVVRGSSSDAPLSPEDAETQIYRAGVSAPGIDGLIGGLDNAGPVTQTVSAKRSPSVSNDGSILYMAHERTAAPIDAVAPSDWSVMLISAGGSSEEKITEGLYPTWVDTSHFVFLKEDGLYVYSLSERSAKKVWDAGEPVTLVMTLAVSHDGSRVAWSSLSAGTLTVLHSNDWEGLPPSVLQAQFLGFTPVFSPNGEQLAVLTSGGTQAGELTPLIRIFDAATLKPVRDEVSVPLPDFDMDNVQLTDWVQ